MVNIIQRASKCDRYQENLVFPTRWISGPGIGTKTMARIAIYGLAFAVVSVILFPLNTSAQGCPTSAFVGRVTASTHAAIPGAAVTVTNHEIGLQRSAKANNEGWFTFPQLKPGSYSVRVAAEGFDPQQNDHVFSGLGQKQTVNFTL